MLRCIVNQALNCRLCILVSIGSCLCVYCVQALSVHQCAFAMVIAAVCVVTLTPQVSCDKDGYDSTVHTIESLFNTKYVCSVKKSFIPGNLDSFENCIVFVHNNQCAVAIFTL